MVYPFLLVRVGGWGEGHGVLRPQVVFVASADLADKKQVEQTCDANGKNLLQ